MCSERHGARRYAFGVKFVNEKVSIFVAKQQNIAVSHLLALTKDRHNLVVTVFFSYIQGRFAPAIFHILFLLR